ncbi:AAA family ATPase [uncultured Gimesia sp.]|uniref:AAA family ATPase n=1 Tax=uncultured Gimesia sp. TaxID=1678688 RepID=UPI00263897EA|nr:AAA family ATPase [uncultured Gimesia sp.]
MSAKDSDSDLTKTLPEQKASKKSGRTASNAVNTEELLASLSMLNLATNDESDESTINDATSEGLESKAVTEILSQVKSSEPMQVVGKNQHLSQLFNRVQSLLKGDAEENQDQFIPQCPETLEDTGLTQDEIERLILKFLLAKGTRTGRQICQQIKLPFGIVDPLLKRAKHDQLVAFGGTAEMGDYEFTITDLGRERARRFSQECTYFGSAPVCFKDYLRAMEAQSIAKQEATEEDLKAAFSDLIINPKMLDRLGPAVNSGRGMFLFGEAGNGKTSIAERITKAFGSTIWIPRCLSIDGDIIRLFDPGLHEEVTQEVDSESLFDLSGVDQRWVQIVRPTVIAGGELTMKELEITQNPQTKICEAPLQMKSNCGTFVIDDFGRQRMPVDELLNRWIVPLEKRYDFLNVPSGKKIQVPFDQLIIFSTNLEPKDLVDAAFLRRIPYKIEALDPSPEEFRALFELMAPMMGFQFDEKAYQYLIDEHYKAVNRPFRACQPRDLLLQVKNFCVYKQTPRKLTPEAFDFAVENYFSVM